MKKVTQLYELNHTLGSDSYCHDEAQVATLTWSRALYTGGFAQ